MDVDLAITLLTWAGVAILLIAGLAGLVLPVIPGPPLLFAGFLLAAWAEQFQFVGLNTLILLGLLCLFAIILDFVAGALGAKRYGASKAAIWGALIGAVVGIVFGPIGILFGPFVGAVIGELINGRQLQQAGLAGFGASIGMLVGIVAKLVIGILMLALFLSVRFLA
ncbi:MAG: DUF456 domain-containing protein [Moraxellaceae bacterium]|nr:DUF456 domain-containing protein [Moraxellaceae bacterium]